MNASGALRIARGVEVPAVGGDALAAHRRHPRCTGDIVFRPVVLCGVSLAIFGLDDFNANQRAAGRLEVLAGLEALEPPAVGGGAAR